MLTPEEHIKEYQLTGKIPSPIWCHCLDVMKHILKGEIGPGKTMIGSHKNNSASFLADMIDHLDGKPQESDALLEARENVFIPERKWKRFDCEFGDLVVERYIDGDARPFDDYRKEGVMKPAVTLIFDMSANASDRGGTYMEKRHKFVYNYAVMANKECRPCRVVAVTRIGLRNQNDPVKEVRYAFILKDYEDPIFPAIWAPFETNAGTNDFLNCVQDYFLGCNDSGNGYCRDYEVEEDHYNSDIILVEPHNYVRLRR